MEKNNAAEIGETEDEIARFQIREGENGDGSSNESLSGADLIGEPETESPGEDDAWSQDSDGAEVLDEKNASWELEFASWVAQDGTSTGVSIGERSVFLPRQRPPPNLEDGLQDRLQDEPATRETYTSPAVSQQLCPQSTPRIRGPQPCTMIIFMFTSFVFLSSFLGLYFTIKKQEYGYSMGDSFTLAGYVIAVGTLVTGVVSGIHFPRCKCWSVEKNKGLQEFELADTSSRNS